MEQVQVFLIGGNNTTLPMDEATFLAAIEESKVISAKTLNDAKPAELEAADYTTGVIVDKITHYTVIRSEA